MVQQFSLLSALSAQDALDYSLFKFGDTKQLAKYSDDLASLISKKLKIIESNYIIYATNKYPYNQLCKKNSLLLAEFVAKRLGLSVLVGEYRYRYELGDFYDDYQQRHNKIHPPILPNKPLYRKMNYKVIMIDDTTVSGNSLRASLVELEQISVDITFVTLINVNESPWTEKELNDFAYSSGDINILSEIIEQNGYIFTSHMIRTIDKLLPDKKTNLLTKLGTAKSEQYKKAHNIYFNEAVK